MPLYEYKCGSCEATFTQVLIIDKRKVPETEPCPECSKQEVKMLISTPMISYSNPGSMKTSDSFNDRLKEIKKSIPPRYRESINANIR